MIGEKKASRLCKCGATLLARTRCTPCRNAYRRTHRRKSGQKFGKNFRASDAIGLKYARLTVIELGPTNDVGFTVLCGCDCGSRGYFQLSAIRRGDTKSCGCLFRDKMRREPGYNLWQQYRDNARRRSLEFTLTFDEALSLFLSNCKYCGTPPSQRSSSHGSVYVFIYSGIDRVDNARGYIAGNVVACCKFCNRAKHSESEADFLAYLKRLVSYRSFELT